MSNRSSSAWIGAALLGCAASCTSPKSLPPIPDDSAAQRSIWQLAPADAFGGVVVADPAQVLERLRALKAVLDTGPATRAGLQKWMAKAILQLGFDPLDADDWKKAGIDLGGPVGVFFKDASAELVFRATDPGKAHDTIIRWLPSQDQRPPSFDCAPAGALHRCGTPGWALAADAAHSLWPRVEADVGASVRSMGVLGYAPLDVGPAKLALDEPGNPVPGMHAGYLGLTLAPERFVLRGGARVDSAAKVLPFLKPRSVGTLLGLGDGAVQTTRMTFSPDALWAYAKSQGGASFDQAVGIAVAATGIDLEKDLVDNLTGETFFITYRGDKRGADGKDRTLLARAGGAWVFGTVDDQKTRHVLDRLAEVAGGAIGTFAEKGKAAGFTPTYTKDAGERAVHWLSVELGTEQAKLTGMSKVEIFATTLPGGFVIGQGRAGLAEMKKRIGHAPSAFLDKLPVAGERELFERAPLASWCTVGDSFAQKLDVTQIVPLLSLLDADSTKMLNEVFQLGQLFFDSSLSIDVSADRAEMFYQLMYL